VRCLVDASLAVHSGDAAQGASKMSLSHLESQWVVECVPYYKELKNGILRGHTQKPGAGASQTLMF